MGTIYRAHTPRTVARKTDETFRLSSVVHVAAGVGVLEVEHVEEVAESRHVVGNVGIGLIKLGIGQIVSTAVRKRPKTPVALDELYKRSVVAVRVLDVAALGER